MWLVHKLLYFSLIRLQSCNRRVTWANHFKSSLLNLLITILITIYYGNKFNRLTLSVKLWRWLFWKKLNSHFASYSPYLSSWYLKVTNKSSFPFVGNCNGYDQLVTGHCVVQFSLVLIFVRDSWLRNGNPASWSSDLVDHSYDYRLNWTPLSPITIN